MYYAAWTGFLQVVIRRHCIDLAMHDELTGLYNRAFYAQYLKTYNVQQNDCFMHEKVFLRFARLRLRRGNRRP